MTVFTGSALYNSDGHPINDQPLPPLYGPDGLQAARQVCRIFADLQGDDDHRRGAADLIYVLPPGPGPFMIHPDDLAELVAMADRPGSWIAFHATHAEAIEHAIAVVARLTGGGRA